jgi:hypothetical protein
MSCWEARYVNVVGPLLYISIDGCLPHCWKTQGLRKWNKERRTAKGEKRDPGSGT